jgi:hypothetical protein
LISATFVPGIIPGIKHGSYHRTVSRNQRRTANIAGNPGAREVGRSNPLPTIDVTATREARRLQLAFFRDRRCCKGAFSHATKHRDSNHANAQPSARRNLRGRRSLSERRRLPRRCPDPDRGGYDPVALYFLESEPRKNGSRAVVGLTRCSSGRPMRRVLLSFALIAGLSHAA